MNKIVTLIIILVGFVQVSFAQIHFNDSTEAYNYWSKRGIIETVYAYMQDYVITVGDTKAKKEIVGKNKYFDEFIQDIDSKKNLPAFTQISTFLENNSWDGAKKKLFIPLMGSYENKVNLNETFFKCTKPGSNDLVTVIPGYNNLNENWNEKIIEIISKYNEALSAFNKTGPEVVDSKSEIDNYATSISQPEERQRGFKPEKIQKQIPWMLFLWYGCFFILGVFIGGWIVYLISRNKIKSIVDNNYNEYLKASDDFSSYLFGYLRVVYFLQKRKVYYENKVKTIQDNAFDKSNLERKVSQLENEKKELLEENIDLGKKLEPQGLKKNKVEEATTINKTSNTQSLKKISKIYFSMPESDGSFQLSNGEPSNDGKKYFRIEFEESSSKGELYYLSGDRDQRAINRLESYLKPVCEIENISNSSTATKVELIQSGKVTLLNNSWIIDPENKIKIKLY